MEATKSRKIVNLEDGKYKIHFDVTGSIPTNISRYDEPWRCVIGDNVILALCDKIEELETALFKLNADIANELRCTDYE